MDAQLTAMANTLATFTPRPAQYLSARIAGQVCEKIAALLNPQQLADVAEADRAPARMNPRPADEAAIWETAAEAVLEGMGKDIDELIGDAFFDAMGREVGEPGDDELFDMGFLLARRAGFDAERVPEAAAAVWDRAAAPAPVPTPAPKGTSVETKREAAPDGILPAPAEVTTTNFTRAQQVWTVAGLIDEARSYVDGWTFHYGAIVLDGTPMGEVLTSPESLLASTVWGSFIVPENVYEDGPVIFTPDPGMHEDCTPFELDLSTPVALLARNKQRLRSLFVWIRDHGTKGARRKMDLAKVLDLFRGKDALRPQLSTGGVIPAGVIGEDAYFTTTNAHTSVLIGREFYCSTMGSAPVDFDAEGGRWSGAQVSILPRWDRFPAERPAMTVWDLMLAFHQAPDKDAKPLAINDAVFIWNILANVWDSVAMMATAPGCTFTLLNDAKPNRAHLFALSAWPINFLVMPVVGMPADRCRVRFSHERAAAPVQG